MTDVFFVMLVGGATRNVGKTSLILQLISKFSSKEKLVCLKIKTIYAGDEQFHGKDKSPLKEHENYRLTEETEQEASEDGAKMLKAGAYKAFKLKAKSEYLGEAYRFFLAQLGEKYPIIVESNSLRDYIQPDVFLLIRHTNSNEMKPSAHRLLPLADKVVFTNGEEHDIDLEQILLTENGWKII